MESLHGSRASAVALLAALLVPAIALAQDPATAPAPGTTQPDTATTPPPAAEQGTTPASPAPPPSAAPGAMTAPPESTTPPQTAAEGESPKGSRKLGEEIVVTGSRIRRKELTSPAPVAVIGREQIQSSGRITVGDFLQAIPEQGNAINTTFNNGGNGSTEISLRNLGSQRTLVLVDGKRFISGTPGGGSLADPGADLNSIPTAAIERIEILKDGASALYGSDAIGGVVNIITRKHFNAVEASATQSLTQHGDGSVTDLNLIGGAASDEGGFSLGVGYFKQNSLAASARDWARFAQGFDYAAQTEAPAGSATAPAGSALVDPSKCSTPLCTALAGAYGAGANTFVPVAGGATAPAGFPVVTVPGVGSWRKFNPATDTYNFQAVNFLVTPSDRFSLYGNGDYKLGGGARAYFHSTLVNRQSSTKLAPVPIVANGFGTQL
ncbi:MAG: TonB-dependent receptor plug domain-containing protein, partial [Anaeromyxobacteraceae bacterium]